MSLYEQEEWKLRSAFKHLWTINLQDQNTLSSIFKSHNGSYEWNFSLESKIQGIRCTHCASEITSVIYCTNCQEDINICKDIPAQPDKLLNYWLHVSLQKFDNTFLEHLEKKKVEIQILSENNEDESIKKEICIDNERSIFSIHFGYIDAEKLCTNNDRDLTIVVRIFDINQSTGDGDFEKLLKSGECSDFKIIVDKKEFLVHKCILAAKSDYFSTMFKQDTKEKIEGVMNITEIRMEVMSELINFIYGAKVDIKEDLLYELLKAADVYKLKDLKTMCEKTIASNLTVENVGKCIEHADISNNEYLKQETIKFIIEKNGMTYKFNEDDINHLNGKLTSVSCSYLASLICNLLKL